MMGAPPIRGSQHAAKATGVEQIVLKEELDPLRVTQLYTTIPVASADSACFNIVLMAWGIRANGYVMHASAFLIIG